MDPREAPLRCAHVVIARRSLQALLQAAFDSVCDSQVFAPFMWRLAQKVILTSLREGGALRGRFERHRGAYDAILAATTRLLAAECR